MDYENAVTTLTNMMKEVPPNFKLDLEETVVS